MGAFPKFSQWQPSYDAKVLLEYVRARGGNAEVWKREFDEKWEEYSARVSGPTLQSFGRYKLTEAVLPATDPHSQLASLI